MTWVFRNCMFCSLFVLMGLISVAQIPEGMERAGGPQEGEEHASHDDKDVQPGVRMWYVADWGAFVDSTKLDTAHANFHVFHPFFKDSHTYTVTYTGNYGTPGLDNNFLNRKFNTPFFFAWSRDAYILSPSELKFVNTYTPYTRLDYSQSENKTKNNETRFNVIHSQNINPWWNFTLLVNLGKSEGQYATQESNLNSVALYSSYNKDEWQIYGGFVSNSLKNYENGGLTADSIMFQGIDPEYWNTNLTASQARFSASNFFVNGEYRFGKFIQVETDSMDEEQFRPMLGVIVSSDLSFNDMKFIDQEDDDNTFFQNTYYPDYYETDWVQFNRLTNLVQLKQYEEVDKKYSFGKRAFMGIEMDRGSMPGTEVNDSTHYRRELSESSAFVGGGIFRETGNFWKWNFGAKFYLSGRKLGESELKGEIYKPFELLGDSVSSLRFSGSLNNTVPDYFQEQFYSNHYRWDQNLNSEKRLTVGGVFSSPKHNLELGSHYAIISNYIYNDTLGIPAQTSKELLVLSAYVDKDFVYRRFHFRPRILWQKVSDDTYLHLPQWSAYVSTYYQFVVSKVLFSQIGADLRYNTKYYADAYNPATGMFYLQNEKQYGDYPYIDVYATVRLKRTKVFFKWMNIGTTFLNREYMTTPHYPMNRFTFRLGVSWAFYD